MASHERLLPGRQFCVGVIDKGLRPCLQACHFVVDLHRGILRRKLSQLHDFAFEFGDRTFKIQISVHRLSLLALMGTWQAAPRLVNKQRLV